MTVLQCKKIVSDNRLFRCISVGLVILFLTVIPAKASRSDKGPVELTIHSVKIEQLDKKYQLMVNPEDQIDTDAVPLYEKAIKSIPKDFNQEQIREWLNLPVAQFPRQQAEEMLQKYLEPLKLVVRAARCKDCNWPQWKPGDEPVDLSGYRKLAFILELWARLEISQGGYEGAIIAMRTGFGMARHLGQAPTIVQGLVGISVGAIMCKDIEQYVQMNDSTNLYQALADMPRPFVDVEKAIENEKKVVLDLPPNDIRQGQTAEQKEAAFDRVRLISKRLDNNLNGLQCVEAIRHFAATHAGQLPQVLDDIKDVAIPNDVMSGKTFEYSRIATGAVIKSVIPEGGRPKDMIHYEIVLKK
jgi:hypothetical protein